ncbi:hypothetical protein GCK72_008865 [Caenorhabditis remanei]|uniref:Uncharacterized protein n=1 Tax=Caenorhabditis remanei TaxID=31234 RepID=A0A6A5H1E8_CAERE|nr:hypothetical protein GCK72_008865 [Caenorhabditis remanei]KAF1760616.1 hypothetical protein GCK72_008865 [Caenorhabditis remanei]
MTQEEVATNTFVNAELIGLLTHRADCRAALRSVQRLLETVPQEDRMATKEEIQDLKNTEDFVYDQEEFYTKREKRYTLYLDHLEYWGAMVAIFILGSFVTCGNLSKQGEEKMTLARTILSGPVMVIGYTVVVAYWCGILATSFENEKEQRHSVKEETESSEETEWEDTMHMSELTSRQFDMVDTLANVIEPTRSNISKTTCKILSTFTWFNVFVAAFSIFRIAIIFNTGILFKSNNPLDAVDALFFMGLTCSSVTLGTLLFEAYMIAAKATSGFFKGSDDDSELIQAIQKKPLEFVG